MVAPLPVAPLPVARRIAATYLTLLLCFALLPLPAGAGARARNPSGQNVAKLSTLLASRYGAEGSLFALVSSSRDSRLYEIKRTHGHLAGGGATRGTARAGHHHQNPKETRGLELGIGMVSGEVPFPTFPRSLARRGAQCASASAAGSTCQTGCAHATHPLHAPLLSAALSSAAPL